MARRKVKAGIRERRGSTRYITTEVIVHRTAERGPVAFEACARFGRGAPKIGYATECAHGRNPRQAIGNAMIQVGRALKKRKGAFRGAK